jgi:hypothetical protein
MFKKNLKARKTTEIANLVFCKIDVFENKDKIELCCLFGST